MYAVVGFALGLGLSYVVFPFPTPAPEDARGIERFIITACVACLVSRWASWHKIPRSGHPALRPPCCGTPRLQMLALVAGPSRVLHRRSRPSLSSVPKGSLLMKSSRQRSARFWVAE